MDLRKTESRHGVVSPDTCPPLKGTMFETEERFRTYGTGVEVDTSRLGGRNNSRC